MKRGDDFYEAEIIDGVYVSRSLKEIWAVNLDLLEELQSFCQKNNLEFFLGFGTLLGAFRHQGFVPWDDDVDILMPRKDFERLKKMWREFEPPYFLQNELSELNFWYRGMMKFRRSDTTCITENCYHNQRMNQGIGLEIMPLDIVSDIPRERRHQEHDVGKWQRLLWAKHYPCGFYSQKDNSSSVAIEDIDWSRWQREAARYSDNELQQEYLQTCQRYIARKGRNFALFIGYNQHDAYRILPQDWFAGSVMMEFHGLQLSAPVGFWECLKYFYGDGFMGYGPKTYHNSHHLALWDTHNSYTIWQKRLHNACSWNGKQVIIFGTGSMAEAFWQDKHMCLPQDTLCVDNNPSMQGRLFHEFPVYSAEKLWEIEENRRHIVICNSYYREIGKQLDDMGIREYYIWVDDKKALFSRAAVGNIQEKQKDYRIAGMYIIESFLNAELLKKINEVKKNCDYLIAFVDKNNKDMKYILSNIRLINRVVFIECDLKYSATRCHCEHIFDGIADL